MSLMPFLLTLAATSVQPADFLLAEQSEVLNFEYGWPAAIDHHR